MYLLIILSEARLLSELSVDMVMDVVNGQYHICPLAERLTA